MKQAQLIRLLQSITALVDRLPRHDAHGAILPAVQRPSLNLAIALSNGIGGSVHPDFQSIIMNAVNN